MNIRSPFLPLFLLIFLVGEARPSFAQVSLGPFFSAGGDFTSINGSNTILPTADAGVVIERQFYISASMSVLIPTIRANLMIDGTPYFIDLFYAGGRLEYFQNRDDPLRYGGGIFFGGGSVGFSPSNPHREDSLDIGPYGISVFLPHFSGEWRLGEGLRLHARLGWRFVFGEGSGVESAGDLGGATLFAGFRFGMLE